jgi:hypothetical protein
LCPLRWLCRESSHSPLLPYSHCCISSVSFRFQKAVKSVVLDAIFSDQRHSFQKCNLAGKDYIMTHLGKTKARKGVCYA